MVTQRHEYKKGKHPQRYTTDSKIRLRRRGGAQESASRLVPHTLHELERIRAARTFGRLTAASNPSALGGAQNIDRDDPHMRVTEDLEQDQLVGVFHVLLQYRLAHQDIHEDF